MHHALPPPHTAADTPESLRSCLGRRGIRTPHGGFQETLHHPGRTGRSRVYPPLCGGGWCSVSSKPPRGVPIPPRHKRDRSDSGVFAAVLGWVVQCLLKTPTGRPYPPAAQAGPKLFWKALTSRSHLNFILAHLLAPTHRSGGSQTALLSASFQGPTISVSSKQGFFGKRRPGALTRTVF